MNADTADNSDVGFNKIYAINSGAETDLATKTQTYDASSMAISVLPIVKISVKVPAF